MKTNSKTMLRGALALSALLVCGLGVSNAAAPVTPVGTWDCTLTGAHGQKGLAFLTFSDDGTNRSFDGFEILVANPTTSTPELNNVRNDGTEQGRETVAATTSTGSTNTLQTLIGFGEISGPWTFDSKGRVVGFFVQLVNASGNVTNYSTMCFSNQVTFTTNFPGSTNGTLFGPVNLSFCFDTATFSTNVTFTEPTNASFTFTLQNTNFTVGPSTVQQTNQISFTGKVSSSKHITLKCSSTFGNLTY